MFVRNSRKSSYRRGLFYSRKFSTLQDARLRNEKWRESNNFSILGNGPIRGSVPLTYLCHIVVLLRNGSRVGQLTQLKRRLEI